MSQLGASEGTVFDAIGLSISGGSQPKMAENIKSQLKVIHTFPRIFPLDLSADLSGFNLDWTGRTGPIPSWTGLDFGRNQI